MAPLAPLAQVKKITSSREFKIAYEGDESLPVHMELEALWSAGGSDGVVGAVRYACHSRLSFKHVNLSNHFLQRKDNCAVRLGG
jgi:hypothetical protein